MKDLSQKKIEIKSPAHIQIQIPANLLKNSFCVNTP